jgi:fatty acid desaturase
MLNVETALPGRPDVIDEGGAAARAFVKRLAPELREWHRISNARSALLLVTTTGLIVLTVAVVRWTDAWGTLILAPVPIAMLQHRLNIIQHEAIHRLLFTRRWLNDLFGHYMAGAAVLTPPTYRLYHFKHHRELGRESDPDRPGYSRFPTTRAGVVRFVLESLIGLGVWSRFLAETLSAISRRPDARAYHEERGWIAASKSWAVVAVMQAVVADAFLVTGGTWRECLWLWVFPEVTLTRTLMAVRLMGEHTTRGDGYPDDLRYLATVRCGPIERALFAPLNFNYHAEHHLFPWVPWHRLPALHARLAEMPEFQSVVCVRRGYLRAALTTCIDERAAA